MGRAILMLVIGGFIARLVASDGYASFVQERMKIPLILAATMLLIFGAIETIGAFRGEAADPESHRRSISPTVGWLLAAPLLVLVAVAPTALGAAAAQRAEPFEPTEVQSSAQELAPIVEEEDGPAEMRVFDFLTRALWDENESLADTEVILEGLVVNDPEITDGFRLTRFAVSCCAADGLPLQVGVRGVAESYDDDTWVRVTLVWRPPIGGTYQGEGAPELVEADMVEIEIVEAPAVQYETPF